MTGAVTGIADPGWVPPVDFVMEMADSTSPAAIYAHTIWTQLKDCIVFAAGDTFAAGSSGGRAKVTLTTVTTSSAGSHGHTLTIGSTGSGQAFSILNPYQAVNIWQRVG